MNSTLEPAIVWLQTGANGLLLVLLLLLMWLWLLVRRRPEVERRVRPRPLTDDELGRVAFRALRSRDPALWRDLFVGGAGARTLLGEESAAAEFLEVRPPEMLDEVLQLLADQVPTGAIYGGIDVDDSGLRALTVTVNGTARPPIPLGYVAKVGAVLRLWGGRPDGAPAVLDPV